MKIKYYVLFVVLLAIAVFICLSKQSQGQVRDFRNRDFTVNVNTTTATMAGGYLPGRRYYLGINETVLYDVRLATFQITQANVANNTTKGIPVYRNGGNWEDEYNIYQSSWWVIISSQGAPAGATALTGTFTYRERD